MKLIPLWWSPARVACIGASQEDLWARDTHDIDKRARCMTAPTVALNSNLEYNFIQ